MGGGSWSSDLYRDREAERARTGRAAFAYHADTATKPHHEQKVHEDMDPKGITVRESRDNAEHPESNAIVVFFDVTGSMQTIPRSLQQKLPSLMDTLNTSGYIKDPQLLFGAVGDSVSDRGSLQVGQFESDNRVNSAFESMWLEGNGGGTMHESYQNAMYFAARYFSMDCFEKRNKKGYIFLIGDELPYAAVNPQEIERLTGKASLQEPLPTADIVKELQQRFNVFMIIPTDTGHGSNPVIRNAWQALLGENVIIVDDIDSICEVIAMTIGLHEGAVTDMDKAREDLKGHGSNMDAVNAAMAAVGKLAPSEGRVTRL